jgi:hypothetical protein
VLVYELAEVQLVPSEDCCTSKVMVAGMAVPEVKLLLTPKLKVRFPGLLSKARDRESPAVSNFKLPA